jgi:chemotaxis response regulator CheB
MPKRVLIADDSLHVRDVLRMFLEKVEEIEICGEAVDGLDAVEKAVQIGSRFSLIGPRHAPDERR